ncbi:MAG: hypothetical protein ACRCX4_03155 [Bacteroidales bacterium]
MTRELLVFFSFLVVFSYILEVFSKKIRIPAVIFLIASGMAIGWIGRSFSVKIPDITPYLMLIGGVSLVLVVLQGAMELKWTPQKNKMILNMLLMCILPMITLSFMVASFFYFKNHTPFTQTLYNVIPIAIISSAIAIPAAQLLNHKAREQIVYESSFSDILGILFFDFVFRDHGDLLKESGLFVAELGGTFILTVLATILIAWLLGYIPSGIRFIPILGTLVFVFEVAEYFQLPALIFIFVFGLFIGNLERFINLPLLHHIKPERILNHTGEFYNIVTELGFLARSFFFLTLGLYVKPSLFVDYHALIWASGILLLAFFIRFLYLKLLRIHVKPNILFAPRGLVTILLFLYIPAGKHIEAISFNVVIMVVLLFTLVLAIVGLMQDEKEKEGEMKLKANHKS